MIKKMLKKIGYTLAILVIAVVAAINANVSSKGDVSSDMSLANVEALAKNENGDKTYKYVFPGNPDNGVKCTCSGDGDESCCY